MFPVRGLRKKLPLVAAHALCFPLSLVSTGSFSSKKKKKNGGGEAAFSGAGLRHRASRFSAAPASSGCRPSGLEPRSPPQADFRHSGGLLRGRQRAEGGARGQLTSTWVQLAHPSSAICSPPAALETCRVGCCSLSRDPRRSVRARLHPQDLGQNPRGAQTSRAVTGGPQELLWGKCAGLVPSLLWQGVGDDCLWAAWPGGLFLNPVRCYRICRLS